MYNRLYIFLDKKNLFILSDKNSYALNHLTKKTKKTNQLDEGNYGDGIFLTFRRHLKL